MKRTYVLALALSVLAGAGMVLLWLPSDWPNWAKFLVCMAPSLAVVAAAYFDPEKPAGPEQ